MFQELAQDPELDTIFCKLDSLDECDEDTLRVLLLKFIGMYSPERLHPTGKHSGWRLSTEISEKKACTKVLETLREPPKSLPAICSRMLFQIDSKCEPTNPLILRRVVLCSYLSLLFLFVTTLSTVCFTVNHSSRPRFCKRYLNRPFQ